MIFVFFIVEECLRFFLGTSRRVNYTDVVNMSFSLSELVNHNIYYKIAIKLVKKVCSAEKIWQLDRAVMQALVSSCSISVFNIGAMPLIRIHSRLSYSGESSMCFLLVWDADLTLTYQHDNVKSCPFCQQIKII